jgi:hypothetical protein
METNRFSFVNREAALDLQTGKRYYIYGEKNIPILYLEINMRFVIRFVSLALAAALSAGLPAAAAAFPDTEGHWAESAIDRAEAEGYAAGFEDGSYHPDESVTAAQVFANLARALSLPEPTEYLAVSAPRDSWYYEDFRKIVSAGLADRAFAKFDEPMMRQDALRMLAKGYGVEAPDADPGVLDAFAETEALDESDRLLLACLVERGLVKGYDGSLHLNEALTRAEFVTLLFRMEDFDEEAWRTILAEEKAAADSAAEDARVLALVNSQYIGNYTLEWAEEHDYTAEEKTRWINLKGYDSQTDWLLWVSITHQRVNIFSGSQENWTLQRSCIVGTGAPGHDTPRGVWRITYKLPQGWTTYSYTVAPVVDFIGDLYAFHSRLYYPRTRTLLEPGIGYPISHGCIRMYDEDIDWLFEPIPVNSTVVVY